MANKEHLEILRLGVEAWNAWREENPEVEPDLEGANLAGACLVDARLDYARLDYARLVDARLVDARLEGANLDGANLVRANLERANLDRASLKGTSLAGARLLGARLDHACLDHASLLGARLDHARLDHASLAGARLLDAILDHACLDHASLLGARLDHARLDHASLFGARLDLARLDHASLAHASFDSASLIVTSLARASLLGTILNGTSLEGANFFFARFDSAIIVAVDLSQSEGLEAVYHLGPSGIATNTLEHTATGLAEDASRRGEIEAFLRGCGLSDWEIEATKLYAPGLSTDELTNITYEIHRLKGESPIQLNPLFISYSHADASFVEALETGLDEKSIRYWRDVHDLKAGKLERQIERAIQHNPTVLLVLSERSVESDWVRWEAQKARELEKELGRDVLCPVALDDAWKRCSWPGWLRAQIEDYYVLDFSEWENAAEMARQFPRLVEGLGINYPKAGGE